MHLSAISFLLATVSLAAASPASSSSGPQAHIIGGTPAKSGEYPFIVGLHRDYIGSDGKPVKNSHVCGASILSPDWILTAAHCLVADDVTRQDLKAGRMYGLPKAKDFRVLAGTLFNSTKPASSERKTTTSSDSAAKADDGTPQEINVDTVYIHPSYDPDEMANDIGLLHLSKPLKLNDKTIAAAKIDSRRISDTTAFEVAGWGLTSNGGEVSDKLLRVQIKANDQKSCTAVRPTYKDQNGDVICTGKTPGRDSCQGDSGGPLALVDEKSGKRTLAGLTSYATGDCGKATAVNFYTHVYYFMPYITAVTGLEAKNLVADPQLKEVAGTDQTKYTKEMVNKGKSDAKGKGSGKDKDDKKPSDANKDDDSDDDEDEESESKTSKQASDTDTDDKKGAESSTEVDDDEDDETDGSADDDNEEDDDEMPSADTIKQVIDLFKKDFPDLSDEDIKNLLFPALDNHKGSAKANRKSVTHAKSRHGALTALREKFPDLDDEDLIKLFGVKND